MIPDPDSFTGRFGTWMLSQPEASGEGVPVIELMNVISNMVHLLRQSFKATEVPHILSYIGFKSEQVIRENGGLWLYNEDGEKFRILLAEEKDEESHLMDLLYSILPDDVSGLDGEEN